MKKGTEYIEESDNYDGYRSTKVGVNNEEKIIDLERYFLIIFQYKWVLVISVFIVLLLAAFYASRLPKGYNSSFNIYYEDVTKANYEYGTVVQSNLDIQYWEEVMKSDRLISLVKETSGFSYSSNRMKRFFSIVQKKNTDNIFTINMAVPDPAIISPLSDAYVMSLNNLNLNDHMSGSRQLNNYLKAQLKKNIDNLEQIEQEIMILSSELNINELTGLEQLKSIFENYKKELKDVRIELSSIVATKSKIQQELLTHRDTLMHAVSFTEPLKVQLMNLHVDLARSLTKYRDDHPIVKGIRNNIMQVESMLKDGFIQNIEVKNLTANPLKRKLYSDLIQMETDEISLNAKAKSLEQVISEFQKQLLPDFKDSGLASLMRKRELWISTISLLNAKIIDAEASLQGKSSSFILIDEPAIPSAPSNKPFILYLIIGFLGGLGLGVALIVGLDFIDNRIKLVSDFEGAFSVPILGIVRHRKTNHTIEEAVNVPFNEMSDIVQHELAEIRININQLIKDDSTKLVSVISPSRREGKTLHSYLVAQEMARSGKKVLLVDLDTFVSTLTKALDVNDKKGIQNYLYEDTTLDEMIVSLDESNLDFISAGTKLYNTPIYYDTPRFDSFVKEVSEQYDMVIFDTPALLFIPEIVSFLEKVHGMIFIAKINYTRRSDMDKIMKRTQKIEAQRIGVILTDIKETPIDKFYNNYYYYDYKYGGNYNSADEKVKSLKRSKFSKYKKRVIASIFMVAILILISGFTVKKQNYKRVEQQVTYEEKMNIHVETLYDRVSDHNIRTNDIIGGCFKEKDNTIRFTIE